VFCGSRFGVDIKYSDAAVNLGRLLVSNGLGLVYGGSKIGLMGVIADAVLEEGGEVIGVMPKDIVEKEIAHNGLTKLKIVETMHQRKATMIQHADGFIALPGGMGTLDEFCEVVTWAQLGYHNKPCGLLNTENYFEHFINFFMNAVSQKFIKPEHKSLILIDDDPTILLRRMMKF
jgi:uncharacterized protein (TIGR00730 family)